MLWDCLDCTTVYAESLDACPQCGSARRQVHGAEPVDEPTTDEVEEQ
jgi:predicted  nucleic acid-binding Zn-ribbon protein